ncbi:SDR family NAD(P)-dependent oxidoreductase [Oceanospirillum sediminis]|uniref:SDR family NAD(P)-dependent oxidoreductase n=1 Tax=Oceanospirillum sediminis TaxID=2760088 RepID=A0A839INZ6_9GAMM|nr:SDR family NAD(P)-dependent oxidoreductase [Oceanospirillum sediminis]MBB1486668.1 SDR family NAD(P)-dependent oxidoreductase [Oceanospirillum sediminis]
MSKVILITGASSGFGRLTALKLLSEQYTVYATMRDINGKNASVAKELSEAGAKVHELDVTDDKSVQTAVDTILQNEDKIDVLVNNAGIAASGISESFGADQIQAMFDVNVLGIFRVTQAVLPSMRECHEGLIINIGSILGRVTLPFFGLYGASKYAVEAMTDSFSYELSQLGIDVVLVQPGAYPTNMYTSAIAPKQPERVNTYGDVAELPAAISSTIASMFQGKNAPQPVDVANSIFALIKQPRGKRDKRVVVGNSFGADVANNHIAPIQSQLMQALGLSALEQTRV